MYLLTLHVIGEGKQYLLATTLKSALIEARAIFDDGIVSDVVTERTRTLIKGTTGQLVGRANGKPVFAKSSIVVIKPLQGMPKTTATRAWFNEEDMQTLANRKVADTTPKTKKVERQVIGLTQEASFKSPVRKIDHRSTFTKATKIV